MLLASFLVGAIILVVEIMGTRVISPYYGASIYVWSSLIGVTLASLSAGYVLGGWAADRWPRLPGWEPGSPGCRWWWSSPGPASPPRW